jgi:ribosomal protein L34E
MRIVAIGDSRPGRQAELPGMDRRSNRPLPVVRCPWSAARGLRRRVLDREASFGKLAGRLIIWVGVW